MCLCFLVDVRGKYPELEFEHKKGFSVQHNTMLEIRFIVDHILRNRKIKLLQ